ncbi:hypothetical protein HMPREF3192_00175 [Atopobium deltae]|uniref:Uncharacterized protein n=1 Tax=Atopobium deltae TaxID=1393034 RepID=A0A133XX86_9ACTN|nr:hypothetical protein HMPREF3192_00175 [Atopobium deltae]
MALSCAHHVPISCFVYANVCFAFANALSGSLCGDVIVWR